MVTSDHSKVTTVGEVNLESGPTSWCAGSVWSHQLVRWICLVSPVGVVDLSGLTSWSGGSVWSHQLVWWICLVSPVGVVDLSGFTSWCGGSVWSHQLVWWIWPHQLVWWICLVSPLGAAARRGGGHACAPSSCKKKPVSGHFCFEQKCFRLSVVLRHLNTGTELSPHFQGKAHVPAFSMTILKWQKTDPRGVALTKKFVFSF